MEPKEIQYKGYTIMVYELYERFANMVQEYYYEIYSPEIVEAIHENDGFESVAEAENIAKDFIDNNF